MPFLAWMAIAFDLEVAQAENYEFKRLDVAAGFSWFARFLFEFGNGVRTQLQSAACNSQSMSKSVSHNLPGWEIETNPS